MYDSNEPVLDSQNVSSSPLAAVNGWRQRVALELQIGRPGRRACEKFVFRTLALGAGGSG